MAFFKPAAQECGTIKMGIYGPPGAGKTYTALKLATSIGKTAMVDTERGAKFYAAEFPHDVHHSSSLTDAIKAFQEAREAGYDCLILDTATALWQSVQDAFLERAKKSGNSKIASMARRGMIDRSAWGGIKKQWRRFIDELLNEQRMHVFVIGRVSAVYGENDKGEEVQVDTRFGAEKDFGHEPDILVEMKEDDRGQHLARVRKDRSGTLQGTVMVNPGPEDIAPLLAALEQGEAQSQHPSRKAAARQDEELFNEDEDQHGRKRLPPAVEAELKDLARKARKPWPGVRDWVYGNGDPEARAKEWLAWGEQEFGSGEPPKQQPKAAEPSSPEEPPGPQQQRKASKPAASGNGDARSLRQYIADHRDECDTEAFAARCRDLRINHETLAGATPKLRELARWVASIVEPPVGEEHAA